MTKMWLNIGLNSLLVLRPADLVVPRDPYHKQFSIGCYIPLRIAMYLATVFSSWCFARHSSSLPTFYRKETDKCLQL